MSSDWPYVRLGEFCIKIGSGATPSGGSSVYSDTGEVCLIRSQNIHNFGFKSDGLVFINAEAANKLRNVVVEPNDVLLNITGDSVARVCLAKKEHLPARVNQHVAIVRPDENEFDPRYLCYQLSSPKLQAHLLSIAAVGATRNALTKGMIENLEVIKPPLSIQKEIAEVLESVDKKIEINRQINQTLEQIAQAMFKSWFVDFEPTRAKIAAKEAGGDQAAIEQAAMCAISGKTSDQLNQSPPETLAQLKATAALFPDALVDSELGEIPEGWEVKEIKQLAEKISKGTTPTKSDEATAQDEKTVPFLKVRDISDLGEISRTDLDKISDSVHTGSLKRSILLTNDLLFSIAGTIGRVALVEEDLNNSNCNQALAYIRLKETDKHLELCRLYLRSALIQEEVASKVVQGVQANFSLTALGEIKLLIPNDVLLEVFEVQVGTLCKQQRILSAQSRRLAEMRDALLPKLLSGDFEFNQCKTIA